jgi:hypothetical protein
MEERQMGIGVGLFLVAVREVLAGAVHTDTIGVDLNTIGYILLAVGAFGILVSMVFWSSWAGPGYWSQRREGPPA